MADDVEEGGGGGGGALDKVEAEEGGQRVRHTLVKGTSVKTCIISILFVSFLSL